MPPLSSQKKSSFSMAALIALCMIGPALAQSEDALDQEAARAALQAIQSSIIVSQEKAEALSQEIAEMDGDRSQQTTTLITAAQRVRLAEIEVGDIESRLIELLNKEHAVSQRLDGADRQVSNLLAALQRISKSPPPAILVNPGDAVSAARGGGLLAAILPQLQDTATTISSDLEQLSILRAAVETEQNTLRANLQTLVEEQLRTATLIEARKRGVSRISAEIAEEERKRAELAARAETLGALISGLKAETPTTPTTPPDSSWTDLDADAIKLALAKTDRREPAVPFAAARGYLIPPAAGVEVTAFGADDGLGGTAHGSYLVTRAEAQVVAPADGWVLYKGPYLNYGQIIILNPGQGYSILLAGLDNTDVELGQFVVMGEPIGTMGDRTTSQAIMTGAGASRPTLYIELREQTTPLNPANWWADGKNLTQTG